ncbi:MAG: hypothetical protein A2Y38_16650 [Spirochaetes bacterium GWB1_59_5]|nr:MAG: hypothetical protein A2Y38_16650 [Spirochaetes bacterium GWB1_59_5]
MLVICDVDGVVADLHAEWYKRYDRDYGDNLSSNPDRITDWDLHKYVKCGTRIYQYLTQPDLYDCVLPVPGAAEGILAIRNIDCRVVFATSCLSGTTDAKFKWLLRYFFLTNPKSRKDYVSIEDKGVLRGDVLIDDGPHNVEAFEGQVIVFDAPWNRSLQVDDTRTFRATNWSEAVSHVARMVALRE